MGSLRIPAWLCARCKGYKRLCGLPECPLLTRFRAQLRVIAHIDARRLEATPPSTIVSEKGYPKIAVLYNLPPGIKGEEARIYDDPRSWWGRLGLDDILRLRSSMVATVVRADARRPDKLYEEEVSIAAVSTRPVGSEAELEKPPRPRLRLDGVVTPVGLAAPARRLRVEENPSIPRILERLISDEDARASEAVGELYRRGIDYYTIIRALSMGLLGTRKHRRLVPTRWAITAVDSIVSAHLRQRLRDKPWISGVESYRAEYLGNRFVVILYPGPPIFEWVEVWHPLTPWTRGGKPVIITNSEDWHGSFQYMDGGFIAARTAVLETLVEKGRQASAVILREVLPSYYAPVGNWHIRETVGRALRGEKRVHRDLGEALREAEQAFQADISGVVSRLRKKLMGQRRLVEWL